ncbi:MAG: NUDIX domain-containing protein [Candidatus Helarchaeota archaeon]
MVDIRHVVTSFLRYQGKILLLQRSSKVGTYQGRWAGCSGYIENDESPYKRALIEIKEELQLDPENLQLIKEGTLLEVEDEEKAVLWLVHPFLFEISSNQIQIDWEHKNYKWISPDEIDQYPTVPKLKEAFERVRE